MVCDDVVAVFDCRDIFGKSARCMDEFGMDGWSLSRESVRRWRRGFYRSH